jgi:hypothetical protein
MRVVEEPEPERRRGGGTLGVAGACHALCISLRYFSALQGRRIIWSGSAPLLTHRLLRANGWAVRWPVPPRV